MSVRLRYLLFFLVAAAPLVDIGHVKAMPLLLLAGPFVVYAAMSLATRGRSRAPERDVLGAALVCLPLLLGSSFLLVSLAMAVAPPFTSDGHPVMPIGQTFLGTAGGVVTGGLLTFAALRRKWRNRTLEGIALHVLGTAVVAAAVVRVVRGD